MRDHHFVIHTLGLNHSDDQIVQFISSCLLGSRKLQLDSNSEVITLMITGTNQFSRIIIK